MLKNRRITRLLDSVLAKRPAADGLLECIVLGGIAAGLEWHELVLAVDEAERMTGQRIHPVCAAPAPMNLMRDAS
jgi:hypothetical protein